MGSKLRFEDHSEKGLCHSTIQPRFNQVVEVVPIDIDWILRFGGDVEIAKNTICTTVSREEFTPCIIIQFIEIEKEGNIGLDIGGSKGLGFFCHGRSQEERRRTKRRREEEEEN